MLTRFVSVVLLTIVLSGCDKQEGVYSWTMEDILVFAETLPGEVYLLSGQRTGPFMQGPGSVGNNNTSGSFFVRTRAGNQPAVDLPAVEGYYFETHSFINQEGSALYVVRKIPFPTDK